jgi:nucleotide-binding universal stress UspA family protein
MYSCVLVPLDGTAAAAAAVPHGLEIARRFGARLVLLRVVPNSSNGLPGWEERDYDARRSLAEGYLDGLTKSLGSADVRIERMVRAGEAAEVILQTARSLGRPLIVLTAYGRIIQPEGAIGHVAEEVLRHAGGPVVLVRPESGVSAEPVEARGEP